MDERDSVLMAGTVLALVFLISHGYLRAAWTGIYKATHGTTTTPLNTTGNPVKTIAPGGI
jgi:hypothetical protein